MRKLSFVLILCLLIGCFVACNDNGQTESPSTDTGNPAVTTQAPDENDGTPTEEVTKAPETPQDKWTQRY